MHGQPIARHAMALVAKFSHVRERWHPVRQFIITDSVAYRTLSYPVSYPTFYRKTW